MFFFKQTTAYEMRSSDWSSVVCSAHLQRHGHHSTQTFRVSPPCPWIASTSAMLDQITVDARPVHQRITQVPSENSTPSATTPVPDIPDTSVSRCSSKRRVIAAPPPAIGSAHVCTPAPNAHLVCRLLLGTEKKSTRLNT